MQQADRNGTTQTVAYTGTAAASTNAVGAQTYKVRLVSNSACHYAFGAAPTATVADPILPANWIETVTVTPGQKVSAIKAATGGLITTTDGSLWMTELS